METRVTEVADGVHQLSTFVGAPVSFGHVEADECGSMNDWLAIAPRATVAQSEIGCMVSIGDLADRAPRPLADEEKVDLGGHVVQWFDTPHVPHA